MALYRSSVNKKYAENCPILAYLRVNEWSKNGGMGLKNSKI